MSAFFCLRNSTIIPGEKKDMFAFSTTKVKDDAKVILKENYWPTVGVSLLLAFASGLVQTNATRSVSSEELNTVENNFTYTVQQISPSRIYLWVIGFVLVFIITVLLVLWIRALLFGPLEVGCRNWLYQKLSRKEGVQLQQAYSKENYRRNVKARWMVSMRVFLWGLLFLIPGLIMSYRYFFVPYLLEDYPDLEPEEILELSKELTNGHKWDICKFNLSFIPWHLLAGLTAGVAGIFYVYPYLFTAQTILYEQCCYTRNLEEHEPI